MATARFLACCGYTESSLAEGSQVNLAIKGLQNYVGTALATQGGNWSQQLTVSKHPSQLVANFENAVVLQQNASEPVQVIAYMRYADGSPVAGQRVVAKLESGSLASFEGAAFQSDADGSVWLRPRPTQRARRASCWQANCLA